MSKIILIIGKSGVGKDTLQKNLVYEMKNKKMDVKEIPLYTTRKKRPGEIDGKEYTFCSKIDFNKLKSNGIIAESRDYSFINDKGMNTRVHYGSADISDYKHDYYITNGNISMLNNYVEMFLHERNHNIQYKNIIDDPRSTVYKIDSEMLNTNELIVIYPYISEEERIRRIFGRESMKKTPNYKEIYRRQYEDYSAHNMDYLIHDSNSKLLIPSNEYLYRVQFNRYSNITYLYMDNSHTINETNLNIIPLIIKELMKN